MVSIVSRLSHKSTVSIVTNLNNYKIGLLHMIHAKIITKQEDANS